jgi:BirA family biotin operon repressor/biotin-[acetyl-CoA-carboxylase] ligase|tara:strand:+ start:277 stop:1107 length:831 start_codon:yes stop_codon:yes gene_type:complete
MEQGGHPQEQPLALELDEEACQCIVESTFLAGCELVEETDSTNDDCLAAFRSGQIKQHPWLFVANHQRRGRGRSGNSWWSAAGALTFSISISLEDPANQSLLSLLSAVACCDALEKVAGCPQLEIKWPNDIYCQGRKLAGILIESPAVGEILVLGIGINLNNSTRQAPGEIARKASAVADIIGTTVSPQNVLTGVLHEIELQLASLRTNSLSITDQWRARCMLKGRTVGIRQGDLLVQGVCQGIDDLGHLVVMDQGEATRLASGSVEWIDQIDPGE